jgi:type III pantothenate kinase
MPEPSKPLIAVDIGNTRLKLGYFAPEGSRGSLPEPSRTLSIGIAHLDSIGPWLAPTRVSDCRWLVGSVQRQYTTQLLGWLRAHDPVPTVTLLKADDLPLRLAVPRPAAVGIDRLLGAVGANALRAPGRPAVVVDLGTAITVDRIGPDGAFEGGAIFPGIGMAARALHEFTDLLPLVDMTELAEPPPPLGTDTDAALRSGLFWGAVGGIRELAARLSADDQALVFLTGGAAPQVAHLIATQVRYVAHLVLGGIALTAAALQAAAWVADAAPRAGR